MIAFAETRRYYDADIYKRRLRCYGVALEVLEDEFKRSLITFNESMNDTGKAIKYFKESRNTNCKSCYKSDCSEYDIQVCKIYRLVIQALERLECKEDCKYYKDKIAEDYCQVSDICSRHCYDLYEKENK